MKVQVVSFHCVLKNKMGKIISDTFNQDILTSCDVEGQHLKGLVNGLQNLRKGEKRRIDLSASEAYGFYDPHKVITVPRKESLTKITENESLMLTMDGERKLFRVVSISSESITLDGNHPLAGQDLVFEIETTSVRDATAEEISQSTASATDLLFH